MTTSTGDTGLILFDASLDPLFLITMIGATPGASVDAYLRRISALLRRGKPFARIVDLGLAEASDREIWKKYAGFMRENRRDLERYCFGTALIVRDSKVRAAISGVAWLEPIRGPHAICLDVAAATQWMRERFREAGLPFPSHKMPLQPRTLESAPKQP